MFECSTILPVNRQFNRFRWLESAVRPDIRILDVKTVEFDILIGLLRVFEFSTILPVNRQFNRVWWLESAVRPKIRILDVKTVEFDISFDVLR